MEVGRILLRKALEVERVARMVAGVPPMLFFALSPQHHIPCRSRITSVWSHPPAAFYLPQIPAKQQLGL